MNLHRPLSVLIVAAFLFAATAIAVVVATSLLFPGTSLDRIWSLNQPAYAAFHVLGKASGLLLLLLAVGTAAAGAGLLRAAKWAWWLAILLFSINGLGDIITLLTPKRDLLKSGSGVVIAAAFLTCLCRPDVIAFFEKRRTTVR